MRSLCLFLPAFLLLPASSFAQPDPTRYDSILVDEVLIEGNESFDDSELLINLQTQETPWGFFSCLYNNIGARFPLAKEPQFFDYPAFQDDQKTLLTFYRNHGFFNAKVEGSYTRLEDDDGIFVKFIIDEGAPSMIDSIAYRNLDSLPAGVQDEVLSDRLLVPGRRYNAADVASERGRVLSILGNTGYPRAFSDSILVERKLSNNNVVIKLGFHHGRRLYFDGISEKIIGVNELNLARQIIYDRLDFRTGDVYSKAALYEGQVSLNRLGVFSYVSLTPDLPPIENRQDSLVRIQLELAPRKRFELAPAVILNNQLRGLTTGAEVSFLMRNVFGGAQSLTTRVNYLGRIGDFGRDFTKTYLSTSQLTFEQPYLFSNKNSAIFTSSYSLVAEQNLARGSIIQFAVGAKRYFSPSLIGDVTWTYEISEFTGDAKALLGRGLINIDTTETINFRNSIRGLSLQYDVTDDLFNPTGGYSLKGLFEEAGYLEDLGISPLPQNDAAKGIRSTEYVKLEGLFRYFADMSANETTIYGFKFRLGGIFRYGRSKEEDLPVPPNRRYYAGGASSVRGWTSRQLASNPELINIGSNALLELSSEFRWHLWPDAGNWLDGFWLVTFGDAGNLWEEFNQIAVREIALAVGFGIRYNMFIGPIRVDFGMKVYDPSLPGYQWFYEKRLWGDVVRKGVFQFGIGHAF
ncbi:BamA/TamA family outer membrane protein [bacterium]|nr:BamA/TamA family outer membrane protein [bacterium]